MSRAAVWAPEQLCAELVGLWRFEREIDNGVCVEGEAEFTDAGGGRLHYAERGRMRLPDGPTLDAAADYLFETAGDGLRMLFPEVPPRLFQHFALTPADAGLVGESLHDCPPDLYRSRIAFMPDGDWSLRHGVSGPRKAYVSLTRYRRADRADVNNGSA